MLKRFSYYAGLAIIASSFSLLGSGFYGAYLFLEYGATREYYPAVVMLSIGLVYVLMGYLLTKTGTEPLKMSEAVAVTVLVWLLVPTLDAIPFAIALGIPYIDALFESVSGWTTTGLTILSGQHSSWHSVYVSEVSAIPETLKVWRTLMQWEGGLGIVIFTIALLAPPGVSVAMLYLAEGKFERLEASLRRSAVKMGAIYTVLTIIGTVLFLLAGMPLGDALQHSMTGIATAGFSTHTESIAYYMNNTWILLVAAFVMFLGSVSFADHFAILTGKFRNLKNSIELHAQLAILGGSILLAFYMWSRDPSFHESFKPIQVWFHVVSAFATAGFQAGDLHNTSESYKVLLAILSIVGGSAFSTAGGIKVLRILISLKSISYEADLVVHARGYMPRRRLGNYVLNEELIRRTLATVTAFILTYAFLVIMMATMYPGMYDLGDIAFEVASAMGNVGLSTGISAAAAPVGVKAILIAGMLLGRLEVVAYIAALRFVFWRG